MKVECVGIIASTPAEADLLLDSLDSKAAVTYQQKFFYSGLLNGNTRIVVCICGVGKTNAAHGATLLLEKFKPDLIYNIGVAGAYPGSGLKVGDIAVAENEFYGDEGLLTDSGFQTIDTLGLHIKFPLLAPPAFEGSAAKGNFVTVSTCTGTQSAAVELERRFNAICENMEGAAIAHICILNNVPVAEIRGISNVVGSREARPLDPACIRTASANVQHLLIEKGV